MEALRGMGGTHFAPVGFSDIARKCFERETVQNMQPCREADEHSRLLVSLYGLKAHARMSIL